MMATLYNTEETEQPFTLSNFRKEDTIEDWPLGGGRRGDCIFTHESNGRGQRIGRQTEGRNGRMNKIKYSTYHPLVCLADGSDGKTHYIGLTSYSSLSVMSCDMKHSEFSLHSWGDREPDANFLPYLAELKAVAEDKEGDR